MLPAKRSGTYGSLCPASVRSSVCLSGSHTFLVVTQSYVSQATHAFLGMLPLCFAQFACYNANFPHHWLYSQTRLLEIFPSHFGHVIGVMRPNYVMYLTFCSTKWFLLVNLTVFKNSAKPNIKWPVSVREYCVKLYKIYFGLVWYSTTQVWMTFGIWHRLEVDDKSDF